MNKPTSDLCLSTTVLRRFLDEHLPESEEHDIQQHLDQCLHCRTALERAAASEAVWDGLRESDPATESSHPTEAMATAIQNYLAPTEDPRYMGRLGSYEILGIIGQGSTGVVLKALEPRLNRYVAIKVLAPGLASNGPARKRFEREGRAIAAVSHEHVVPIYAVDEHQGLPYIVMQYVPGVSLLQRIAKSGSLNTTEVARVGYQVALGLAAAHKQGIVHRDVKPANVLLEETVDRAMVTDFGMARVADDGTMTRTGTISGTPQYMSPEQARGEAIDSRTDLFSLGGLLYAACTARAPFRAETVFGIIHRVCETEPRPIREINPDIAPWLVRFIEKLMAKQPVNRFASAGEVALMLEEELAHLQNPTVIAEPLRQWLPVATEPGQAGKGKPTRNASRTATAASLIAIATMIGTAAALFWPGGLLNRPAVPVENGPRSLASNESLALSGLAGGNVAPQDEPVVSWTREETDETSVTSQFVQRTEQAFELVPGSRLVVDSELGDIELRQTELDFVSLVIIRRIESATQAEAEKIASYHDVAIEQGDALEIQSQLDPDFAARSGADRMGQIVFGIGVPAGMTIQINATNGDITTGPLTGKLELTVHDGDIECDSIQGDLWARAVGGEIVATAGCSGSVDLMATHGNVCASGIAETARLRASHGNIYVGPNGGNVSAHATGGDIRIASIASETSGHVESGNLHIDLDESPAAASRFSVTSGNIFTSFTTDTAANVTLLGNAVRVDRDDVVRENASEPLEMPVNGGGQSMELTALTGSIELITTAPAGNGSAEDRDNPYFSLGGSGNEAARRTASREAVAKTTGLPRPGAMVPVAIENGGNIDGYTLYLPVSYNENESNFPLILYLQGGYGVGGPITQLNDWGLPRLIRDENDLTSERNQLLLDTFIVVSIHIDEGQYHDHPEVIKRILDDVSDRYRADRDRVYVTGLSRGGHGSWGLCSELPNVFAAAVPIGGLDENGVDYSVFGSIPVWIAHNQRDTTIEFANAESSAEKVESAAGVEFRHFDQPLPPDEVIAEADYLFTHPDLDRHDAWTELYTSPLFYQWLLRHSRN